MMPMTEMMTVKKMIPVIIKGVGRLKTCLAAFLRRHVRPVLAVRRSERGVALAALLLVLTLNALLVWKFWGRLTPGGTQGYYTIFMKRFQVSGFDASSCIALSCEDIYFNSLRHPLFFTILWPFHWLDRWLMQLTGLNCAILIMAALQTMAGVYSALFLHRTLTDVLRLERVEAGVLTLLFFSFAYIMLSTMVPDHFGLSLPWLLLTVWLAGRHFACGTAFRAWQQAVLVFFTSGLTLTNGVKSCLAFLFAAPRRVWRLRSVAAVAVPLLLLLAIRQYQNFAYEEPMKERVAMMLAIKKQKDPNFGKGDAKVVAWRERQNGKAIDKDNILLQWSDITTPRLPSLVHNLLGESFLLHRRHLLEDVQNNRPVFVAYDQWPCRAVGPLLAALLVAGAWCGRRSRLMLMLLSWLAFDILMHFGFGFGLNEVYIMTAHWAFIIPVAAGFVLRAAKPALRRAMTFALAALAVAIMGYNLSLITAYCVG